MKYINSVLLILVANCTIYAQQISDTLSVSDQFSKIYRTSSSYKEYKVIQNIRFLQLEKIVSDSINQLKQEVVSKNELIASQKDSIHNVKEIARIIESDFRQTLAQKNSINFLGITFLKSRYNTVVWLLIIILMSLLCYFIYKFKNSNSTTAHIKVELQELEEEYSNHRKKSLEREQKLRRQLQDEINKQRGS